KSAQSRTEASSEREVTVHSDAPRRPDDQRPGLVRERHAAFDAFCAARTLGFAGRHDRLARYGFRLQEPIEIARHIGVEDMRGVDLAGVEVEREHAVREFAIRFSCAIAGERAADEFTDEREAGALVLAEGPDSAGATLMVARPLRGQRAVEQRGIAGERAIGTDQCVGRQWLAPAG